MAKGRQPGARNKNHPRPRDYSRERENAERKFVETFNAIADPQARERFLQTKLKLKKSQQKNADAKYLKKQKGENGNVTRC